MYLNDRNTSKLQDALSIVGPLVTYNDRIKQHGTSLLESSTLRFLENIVFADLQLTVNFLPTFKVSKHFALFLLIPLTLLQYKPQSHLPMHIVCIVLKNLK